MKKISLSILLFFVLTFQTFAAVELDTDGNQAIDINRGGTNAKTAGAALSNLGGQPYDADLDILSSGSFGQKRALIGAFAKPVFGVDALRTTIADFDGDCRYLVYHTAYGDGGHGTIRWDASSTAADDNGYTIAVAGVAIGRWIRQHDGPHINVRWWGIHANLIDDDSVAIQAAIDYANSKGDATIYLNSQKGDLGIRLDNTIVISKNNLCLSGDNISADRTTSAIAKWNWYGAAGEPMIHMINPLRVTLRNISLHGRDLAGYGILWEENGGGLNNCEYVNIRSCTKNAIKFTGDNVTIDNGINRFYRNSLWINHVALASPSDNAVVLYSGNSNVADRWDSCTFYAITTATGVKIADTFGVYFLNGGPRVYFNECYTKAATGVHSGASAGPALRMTNHYSEDNNFVVMESASSRAQRFNGCDHVVPGGISLQIKSTQLTPIVVDGGSYDGSCSFENTNCPVVLTAVQFDGGDPTFTEPHRAIWLARSPGTIATASGALQAGSFIPASRAAQTSTSVTCNLALGEIFPVGPLTGNTAITAPTNVSATLDIGRVIELRITGHATNLYTVTFNAIFKKAGGAYTHSGAGKTDILRFRYDGTTWNEISRSMDIQ